jgi:hypothetical protein
VGDALDVQDHGLVRGKVQMAKPTPGFRLRGSGARDERTRIEIVIHSPLLSDRSPTSPSVHQFGGCTNMVIFK